LKNFWKRLLGILVLAAPAGLQAAPGQISLSLDTMGALASSPIPLTADEGVGFSGTVDDQLSDFFALGLTGGLVEFIAPHNVQDMKTIWLDLDGRFFPFELSPLGQPYFQLGLGFSTHLALFPDYWPNYTSQGVYQQYYKEPPGVVYWDAQAVVGYLFTLSKDWALDAGLQYDLFWPPINTPLQTIGLKAGIVWSFGL
jgi:hypothetical protein